MYSEDLLLEFFDSPIPSPAPSPAATTMTIRNMKNQKIKGVIPQKFRLLGRFSSMYEVIGPVCGLEAE